MEETEPGAADRSFGMEGSGAATNQQASGQGAAGRFLGGLLQAHASAWHVELRQVGAGFGHKLPDVLEAAVYVRLGFRGGRQFKGGDFTLAASFQGSEEMGVHRLVLQGGGNCEPMAG